MARGHESPAPRGHSELGRRRRGGRRVEVHLTERRLLLRLLQGREDRGLAALGRRVRRRRRGAARPQPDHARCSGRDRAALRVLLWPWYLLWTGWRPGRD